jgi:hypothetical protein
MDTRGCSVLYIWGPDIYRPEAAAHLALVTLGPRSAIRDLPANWTDSDLRQSFGTHRSMWPRFGEAAERLLALAREREADLIVVGSREHGFLDRLLGQHVDQAVAAYPGGGVLLVR